jgi:predicted transcriptional regulator of viral defense system
LISALFQYGLTDTIPKKTWIMVPAIKRSQHSILKLQRIKDPRWNTGIVEQNGYCITSIERTVVEALCARNRIGTQIAIEALRKAVNSKKTSLAKIMSMAKQLDVIHRILPYIEALS